MFTKRSQASYPLTHHAVKTRSSSHPGRTTKGDNTMTEEDLTRLLESRHDIQAATDPARLTPDPAHQAAITASRHELANARAHLVTKVALNTQDASETD